MGGAAGMRLSTPWRVVSAAIGIAALAVAIVGGMGCLSRLYASVAIDVVRHAVGKEDGLAAAEIAASLAPWRATTRMALAQSLSANGRFAEARRQAEAAARLQPADGYTWAYLARIVGASPDYPPELAAIYRMATGRSPSAAPLHWTIAMDGVRRWRHGDEELHSLWRASMEFTLRHNRRAFLTEIFRLGRDPYWCTAHESILPVTQWCARARWARETCSAGNLPPKLDARCRQLGLDPGP